MAKALRRQQRTSPGRARRALPPKAAHSGWWFNLAVGIALLFVPATDPWLGLTTRSIGIALLAAIPLGLRIGSPTSVLISFSMLTFAPAFFGERSGVFAAVALTSACIIALTRTLLSNAKHYSSTRTTYLRVGVVMIPVSVTAYWLLVWSGGSSPVAQPLSAYFLIISLAILILATSPQVVRRSLALFALTIAVLGYAWLIALPAMVINAGYGTRIYDQLSAQRLGFTFIEWGPLVITNGQGSLGAFRLSQLGGEPGTWAILTALGFACAIVTLRGPKKWWIAAGCAAGFAGSQSTGAWIAAGTAYAVVAAVLVLLMRARLAQTLLLVSLVCVATPLVSTLIDQKVTQNAFSLTARGIGALGGLETTTASSARINLASSAQIDGVLVSALPMLAILLFGIFCWRSPVLLGLAIFVGMMVLFIQPIVMHPTVWLTMSLLCIASRANASVAGQSHVRNAPDHEKLHWQIAP